MMTQTTSSDIRENPQEDNVTLTAGLAVLALGDQVRDSQLICNGDLSTRSSTSTEENDTMRPFIDPGLVTKRRKRTNETWLSDFVSPGSAPQSSYSPIAQAVKKLLPERTACRLGKEICLIECLMEDFLQVVEEQVVNMNDRIIGVQNKWLFRVYSPIGKQFDIETDKSSSLFCLGLLRTF